MYYIAFLQLFCYRIVLLFSSYVYFIVLTLEPKTSHVLYLLHSDSENQIYKTGA